MPVESLDIRLRSESVVTSEILRTADYHELNKGPNRNLLKQLKALLLIGTSAVTCVEFAE